MKISYQSIVERAAGRVIISSEATTGERGQGLKSCEAGIETISFELGIGMIERGMG